MNVDRRVAVAAAIQARRAKWRQEHPQASFDEIENAVPAELVAALAQTRVGQLRGHTRHRALNKS